METPAGAEASVRLRSALAQGGSPAARGKRNVFPERIPALNQRLQGIVTTSSFISTAKI
ncbi:hypothetical protein ACUL41_11195 [Virgibacillus natechei]|uniref:hypothetical protein n=1 Tax=Virgibacillus sp. CBA3643 TaxID=2942278 RepID=UPI0035A2CC39